MALNGFAPSASTSVIGSNTNQVATISGTTVLVTNVGSAIAYVALAATVTAANEIAVLPGTSIALTVSGTQLAVIGQGAILNIVSGV